MSKLNQRHIAKYFPENSILYSPGLARIFESPNVSVLLCQLLYWHDLTSRKDGWMYKTIEQMHAETGLSRDMQRTAIDKLKSLGILETKLAQIPARRHFRLNLSKLDEIIPSLMESHNIVYLKRPSSTPSKPTAITENTTKTTTKIKAGNKYEFLKEKEALVKKLDGTKKVWR